MLLLSEKNSHLFHIVPFYPPLSWTLTYTSSEGRANSFCTTNKIQTSFQGWLWVVQLLLCFSRTSSLPDYAVVTLANFQFLRSSKCFHSLGLLFLCFHFPRTLSLVSSNVVHPMVLDAIIIFALQVMKLKPERLSNLPKG